MKHGKKIAVVLLALLSSAVHAGPYTDDLSKCLVESTTTEDHVVLIRWMFAALSAHPAVHSMVQVSADDLEKSNAALGALLMKLLTETCREQATKAMKYEGSTTVETSFSVFGQVAARELFANPEVQKAMAGLQNHIDAKKLQQLNPDAPQPTTPPTAPPPAVPPHTG